MTSTAANARRRLAPEIVQTSAMDCGPAALACLLEGFGVRASYGRLREACQTDVDGTSIDTLEDVARRLGLQAEQKLVPADHLPLAEAALLPALVVVRRPSGLTHFVVAWSTLAGRVQVMDPATGRRWPSVVCFGREIYLHPFDVPAAAFREWAASDEFVAPLRRRLECVAPSHAPGLIDRALAADGWRPVAALDAAARMATALVAARAVRSGDEAAAMVAALSRRACDATSWAADVAAVIPHAYWFAHATGAGAGGSECVRLRGAVVVTVRGLAPRRGTIVAPGAAPDETAPLTPSLAAALAEAAPRPAARLVRLLGREARLPALVLAAATAVVAGATVLEGLVLRALFDLGRGLGMGSQRLAGAAALLAFLAVLAALEMPLATGVLRLGRRLEARLRLAFLAKLPRLGDRYLRSRLASDMAERAHGLAPVRTLPLAARSFLQAACGLVWVAAALVALHPAAAALACIAALLALAVPLGAQPLLAESDLRARTHAAALLRVHLDALVGLTAVRAHAAEDALRHEHEQLLGAWAAAAGARERRAAQVEALAGAAGLVPALALVWSAALGSGGAGAGTLLLLAYWALSLPAFGRQAAAAAQHWPLFRNLVLRLLEPLGAPDEDGTVVAQADATIQRRAAGGVALALDAVELRASGHVVLSNIDLHVAPGEHVAVVGPSGAGKSSLLGLLLGWHRADSGRLRVDGHVLDGAGLLALRAATAWLDPTVQLWNRTLLDNLRYGTAGDGGPAPGALLDGARLETLVERLPDGWQTRLGEGGALVSGGEGQRVRLARALAAAPGARLALLDEPFRGLDRRLRAQMLARARERFSAATLLCVTHDLAHTRAFPRVIVLEGGRIVEDGAPQELEARRGGRYRALLAAERSVRARLWRWSGWRRWRLRDGRLAQARSARAAGEPRTDSRAAA